MTRLTLFITLSLAACGAPPEPEAPAGAEMPQADDKHDDAAPHEGHATPHDGDTKAGQGRYACPMHPDITADKPGDCSKCGMALVEQEEHDHSSHEHGEHHETTDDHGH